VIKCCRTYVNHQRCQQLFFLRISRKSLAMYYYDQNESNSVSDMDSSIGPAFGVQRTESVWRKEKWSWGLELIKFKKQKKIMSGGTHLFFLCEEQVGLVKMRKDHIYDDQIMVQVLYSSSPLFCRIHKSCNQFTIDTLWPGALLYCAVSLIVAATGM